MREDVLVLGLHQEVALRPDVLQEAEDVDGAALLQHVHHGVQHDVGAGPAHTSAVGNDTKLSAAIFISKLRALCDFRIFS